MVTQTEIEGAVAALERLHHRLATLDADWRRVCDELAQKRPEDMDWYAWMRDTDRLVAEEERLRMLRHEVSAEIRRRCQ